MADIITGRAFPGNNSQAVVPIRMHDSGDGTWAEVISASVTAGNTTVAAATNVSSTAYEASHIIKNAAGILYTLTLFNSSASAQFYQFHDSATVPADTAIPVLIVKVPAGSPGSFDYGLRGRSFANGIVVCNSSTGPTKTVGSADSWFDAQFI